MSLRKIILLVTAMLWVAYTSTCFAFTSIAMVKGEPINTHTWAANYKTQKDADAAALEGCRAEARKAGIGHLAKKCTILARGKGPGFGTVICGDNGCAWGTGYDSSQDAVDSIYEQCAKNYTNCLSKNIKFFEDNAGFKSNSRIQTSKSCVPKTNSRQCTSQCFNGDCVVTYQNGCKVRVQVNSTYNPSSGRWEYPSPGC